MPHWTVDTPTSLDFDDVTALEVRLIAGTVAVMATDDKPSVLVTDINGRPLMSVTSTDGLSFVAITATVPAISRTCSAVTSSKSRLVGVSTVQRGMAVPPGRSIHLLVRYIAYRRSQDVSR